MPDDMGFFEAWEVALAPLVDRQHILGLVEGLEESGGLARLAEPVRRDQLADALGTSPATATEVLRALLLHSVVDEAEGAVRLTAPWRALVADDAFVAIGDALRSARLEARLLRGIGSGDYWSMDSADRILLARSISPNPFADGLVALFRRDIESDPERRDLLDPGCRLLELGCGVAGRLLTTLRAVPTLSAVGVELSPDLADEARRRAEQLGVADRFTVVCADAGEFRSDEPFDRAFWSQFFFAEASREGALRTLHDSLRPGGVVGSPVAGNAASDAVFRVLVASWGVPLHTPDELAEEYAAAGFVDVEIVDLDSPRPTTVRAVRP